MTRPKTIGVALDIDESPAVVLRHAAAWARHVGAVLHIVTVSDDPSAEVALGELTSQLPSDLRHAVSRVPVPRDTDDGSPISRALGGLDVDLVLVGTHARKGIDRLLFGSVATAVVRHSALPVLVCPLHTEPARGPIVAACPVDPDELDWTAVQWLADHVPAAIHVLAAYPHETTLQQLAGADLDESVRRTLEQGIASVTTSANVTLHGLPGLTGSPAPVLADAADRIGVDLIALHSHQRHGAARWWYGSVAEKVVREANCAVLVVPMRDVPDA